MENVISEFKVIETDDGFRIEIKGDKERIKSFIGECGTHSAHRHWRGHLHGFGWGPWPMHPRMWSKMRRCWETWYEDTEEEPQSDSA